LLFAPPNRRQQQALRAEKLHDELLPDTSYPFDFLHYRITRFRTERVDSQVFPGHDILPDLRLLIDRLTRSAPIPITDDDPVHSVENLAATLHVSTKTISRWRKAGLRWRWSLDPKTQRKHLAIHTPALDKFLREHPALVPRAASFTRLTSAQRERMILHARTLARGRRRSMNQVAMRLAHETGRALETVRQILEKHDRENPDHAIFPDRSAPLSARDRRVIARAHRMGVSTAKLAEHFARTPSSIRRVVGQRRAARWRKLNLHHITLPTFDRPDADQVLLLTELPQHLQAPPPPHASPPHDVLPSHVRHLFTQPRLDSESVARRMVRMNYLLFKASRARDTLDRYQPRVREIDNIENWVDQARIIRDELVAAHLPEVLAVASRHWVSLPPGKRSASLLGDLLELGLKVLIDAVAGFDPSGERTFEKFLNWALMRAFASHTPGPPHAQRRPDEQALLKRMNTQAEKSGVRLPGVPEAEHA